MNNPAVSTRDASPSFSPRPDGEGQGVRASDPELTATADLIRSLRAELAAARELIADQARQLDDLLADQRLPAPPRPQIAVRLNYSESELQRMLDDGWNVLYMQFAGRDLHVVFVRGMVHLPALGSSFPIAAALQQQGIDAVEAEMNGAAFAAGRDAYNARTAATPKSAFRAIPARVPGR